MRARAALLFAAAPLFPLAAQAITTDRLNQSITPDMRVLPLHTVGRIQATPLAAPLPTGSMAYRHEWPGVYFEGAFVGDRVTLRFDDAWHEYRLRIDGRPPITLAQPGKSEVTVSGLGATAHRLRLEKVSESFNAPGIFAGFYIPRNQRPLTVKPRPRQIEFIGPSGMTGYGDRSAKIKCTPDELARATDTQQAYTALIAKHYGADYQINANSGHGLIRNGKKLRREPGLIALYPFTFSNRTIPYSDRTWQPQIIEIMGLADLADTPAPDERWSDIDALMGDWTKALEGFVAELHRRSPRAALLIEWPTETDIRDATYRAKFAAMRQRIAGAARRARIRAILFPTPTEILGKLARTGCDRHASLRDHRMLADWFIAYIDAHPGLWNGT